MTVKDIVGMTRILLLSFLSVILSVAASVPTSQYDNTRNSVTSSETVLTPATVTRLLKIGTYSLDGQITSQPIYIAGSPNLIIVGTMGPVGGGSGGNTLYAFNADQPGSSAVWTKNFGSGWASAWSAGYYGSKTGIQGTVVADSTYVYVLSTTSTPNYVIHKVAISTGVESGSGTTVSGSNNGVTFNPAHETPRLGLTLANGDVYFGFSAGNEPASWQGWLFSYDTATLTQQAVLCLVNSSGNGAAPWMSAGAPVVDGSGNLYFATGNGTYDGSANFGQSIVKVNSTLVVQDWFTPSNYASTNSVDADLSSGRLFMIPGTNYLSIASKDGRAWVVDNTNMGHLQGGGGQAPQVFTVVSLTAGGGTGTFGGIHFNGAAYFPTVSNPLNAFTWNGASYNTTASATTAASYYNMALAGSSNAGASPVLWALTDDSSSGTTQQPVTLRAYNPATLTEYWNSGATIGNYAKWISPVVANGNVYVATSDGTIVAFGGITPYGSVHGGSMVIGGSASGQ